jgi:hypothetical protein
MTKNLLKKIKEAIDYGDYPERMDPESERHIGDPERNLYGTNPAMGQGTADVEKLASARFKKVVDKLRDAMGVPNLNPEAVQQSIMNDFSSSVTRAQAIESRFQERLEALAVEAGLRVTETPEGRYTIKAELITGTNSLSSEKFQFKPKPKPDRKNDDEDNDGNDEEGDEEGNEGGNEEQFDADTLTDDEEFKLEVHKRNIINAIMAGAAKKGHYIFQDPEVKAELDEMDPNLYRYYLKIMAINDYFYFKMGRMINQMSDTGGGIGGREDVTSKKKKKGPEQRGGGDEPEQEGGENEPKNDPNQSVDIHARAVLFPVLCHEVVKGIEEALGKFGYAKGEMAKDVIGQADTLPNEAMSLRIGPELVDRIREYLPAEMFAEENVGIKPFFYMHLYKIPAAAFLKIISYVVSDDDRDKRKAVNKFEEIFQKAIASKRAHQERQNKPKTAEPNAKEIPPSTTDGGLDDVLGGLGIGKAKDTEGEPPSKELDDKQLAGMGLNALNFEMNKAIDAANWDLARRIQKMIERKQR